MADFVGLVGYLVLLTSKGSCYSRMALLQYNNAHSSRYQFSSGSHLDSYHIRGDREGFVIANEPPNPVYGYRIWSIFGQDGHLRGFPRSHRETLRHDVRMPQELYRSGTHASKTGLKLNLGLQRTHVIPVEP